MIGGRRTGGGEDGEAEAGGGGGGDGEGEEEASHGGGGGEGGFGGRERGVANLLFPVVSAIAAVAGLDLCGGMSVRLAGGAHEMGGWAGEVKAEAV